MAGTGNRRASGGLDPHGDQGGHEGALAVERHGQRAGSPRKSAPTVAPTGSDFGPRSHPSAPIRFCAIWGVTCADRGSAEPQHTCANTFLMSGGQVVAGPLGGNAVL